VLLVPQLATLPLLLEDEDREVVVKMMQTNGRECRMLEQLLGVRPWPADAAGRRRDHGGRALWESLRLVPLAHDGIVRFGRQPGVCALAMRKLVTLTQLSRKKANVLLLLRVVSQLVEVCRMVCVTVCFCVVWTRRAVTWDD
jgi:hypothetical protein